MNGIENHYLDALYIHLPLIYVEGYNCPFHHLPRTKSLIDSPILHLARLSLGPRLPLLLSRLLWRTIPCCLICITTDTCLTHGSDISSNEFLCMKCKTLVLS